MNEIKFGSFGEEEAKTYKENSTFVELPNTKKNTKKKKNTEIRENNTKKNQTNSGNGQNTKKKHRNQKENTNGNTKVTNEPETSSTSKDDEKLKKNKRNTKNSKRIVYKKTNIINDEKPLNGNQKKVVNKNVDLKENKENKKKVNKVKKEIKENKKENKEDKKENKQENKENKEVKKENKELKEEKKQQNNQPKVENKKEEKNETIEKNENKNNIKKEKTEKSEGPVLWTSFFQNQKEEKVQEKEEKVQEKKTPKPNNKNNKNIKKPKKKYSNEGKNLLKESILKFDEKSDVFIQPRGLLNVNNSCYVNAILQSLLFTPPFFNLFLELTKLKIDANVYPLLRHLVHFVNEFNEMDKSSNHIDPGKPFHPAYLLESLYKKDNFKLIQGNEQDAHEFFTLLIQFLHEEMQVTKETLNKKQSNDKQARVIEGDEEDDKWIEVGKRNKTSFVQEIDHFDTSISEIFSGKFKSIVKKKNSKPSITLQPFYSLPLPIEDKNIRTLKDCFQTMVHQEYLDSGLTKIVDLQTLPKVLVLNLKRFKYTENGQRKLSKNVQFFAQLYLDDYIIPKDKLPENDKKRNYNLCSVICHHGKEATSGHYSTFVLHPCGKWVHLDDSKVTIVSQNHVMKQQAYMLIYCQQEYLTTVIPNNRKSRNNKKKNNNKREDNLQNNFNN